MNKILRVIAIECSEHGTKGLCNYCKHQGSPTCKSCLWKVNDKFEFDYAFAERRAYQFENDHPEIMWRSTE